MTKVAIVQNIIVPYEVPLFITLGKYPDIDLTVYYCKRTYKERKWDILESDLYKYEVLHGITFEFHNIISSFNPSIINRLRMNKPDVIILSGGYNHITVLLAFLFGKISNIPLIYRSYAARDDKLKSSSIAKIFRTVEKYVTMKSQAVICPGSTSREYHIENGANPEKVFISPYTTSDDNFFIEKSKEYHLRKNEIKNQLGIKEKKVILFVSQFIKAKGIIYLLEAFKKLSNRTNNLALVLLGDGPLTQKYKKYCKENDLELIYFTGFVDGGKKIKYYSIADVLVLPTLRDLWGLVINEAMLCGLLVDANNVEEIKDAIIKLRDNPELCEELGANGRRAYEERYSWEIMERRLIGLYQELTKSSRG